MKINQRKDDKNRLPQTNKLLDVWQWHFPSYRKACLKSNKPQKVTHQASTGIINSCKSRWWARESRQAVGRYREWKIHLNEPNQSNIHRWHLSQKEKKQKKTKHLCKGGGGMLLSSRTNRSEAGRKTEQRWGCCTVLDALFYHAPGSWGLAPAHRKERLKCSLMSKALASSSSAPVGSTPRGRIKIRQVLPLKNRVDKRQRAKARMDEPTRCN